MKIYFSQVPDADVDNFGDEDLFGPNKAGNFFYNQIEFGTNPGGIEEVAISDGCNRYIPICVDTIPELIEALNICYNLKSHLDSRAKVEAIVESETEAYVNDNQVYFDRESVQDIIDSASY
jgi:hypothetical protein